MTPDGLDPYAALARAGAVSELSGRVTGLQHQWWLVMSLGLGEDAGRFAGAWREAALRAVDEQATLLETAGGSHGLEGSPATRPGAHEEPLRAWTDVHRAMWLGLLAASAGTRVPGDPSAWEEAGAAMIGELEDMAVRLIDEQAAWATAFPAEPTPPA